MAFIYKDTKSYTIYWRRSGIVESELENFGDLKKILGDLSVDMPSSKNLCGVNNNFPSVSGYINIYESLYDNYIEYKSKQSKLNATGYRKNRIWSINRRM